MTRPLGLEIAFFGSSLVSAYWNGAATYYRGIIRALAFRGHRITFYEPDAYERQAHRDIADPPWAKVVVYPATEDGVLGAIEQARGADLVVKASGVGVFDELLERAVVELRGGRTRAVLWDVDAPATLDRMHADPADPLRQLLPRFDLVFTYGGGPPVVNAYTGLGARACVPIYNALDPDTHHPVRRDPRFAADLSFLGNRLPDREQRVEEFFLRAAAAAPEQSFLLGGSGWDDKPMPPNVRAIGHVYTADHNALNVSARAVLNISRESMARYGFSPATRVFEAAGAGACLITDAWEGVELFLEPGAEVLVAGSAEEVVEHLRAIGPEEARAIGERARQRMLAEHTYAHRARRVEEALGVESRVRRISRPQPAAGAPPLAGPGARAGTGSGQVASLAEAARRGPRSAAPGGAPEGRGALRIVFLGLSITSSWGNGHATTYRGLVRELCRRGHDVLFLERDVPWYAEHRDLPRPPHGQTRLYGSLDQLKEEHGQAVAAADLVVVGSFVPDGVEVGRWVQATARGVTAFYDIDTPVTLSRLLRGVHDYLSPALIPRYDLYLSFAGGPTLGRLEREFGAPRAVPLYCSVDPEQYTPPGGEPTTDLGYMGTYSADRQPGLERLLLEPARRCPQRRFEVAGPMYPDHIQWPANVARQAHLPPAEHPAFYGRLRFTLNLTRADMTRAGYSPSVRLFEAAACGTPVISDHWPGLEVFFAPGREILIARSGAEVVRLLQEVSEEERRALGERARSMVLARHTAGHRALELECAVAERQDAIAGRRGRRLQAAGRAS